jgi:hypothetical protein
MRLHLNTDFLVYALSTPGPERRRLRSLADSDAELQVSAVAWYEFSRGPRTPEQLAVALSSFGEDGGLVFSQTLATRLLEFGRFAAEERKRNGWGRPDTFDLLAFTHVCTRTGKGRFAVLRRTSRKRMRRYSGRSKPN